MRYERHTYNNRGISNARDGNMGGGLFDGQSDRINCNMVDFILLVFGCALMIWALR